jgi:hypothetical protein
MTRCPNADVLEMVARLFLNGNRSLQLVNGTPILEWLASLQWDRSIFLSTDIASRLNCAASPAQVNEVAATLRSRIIESL